MSEKKEIKQELTQAQSKSCFVIMPISDVEGYDSGHFDRVFNFIIKPACEKAGFVAKRADKNNKANMIVVDILKQIVNSDMAICDLSSRNSNVFFELGLRQAFNLKTVLIKDTKTPRSFDISTIRCIDYDEKLRVDNVESIVEQISKSLTETMESKEDDVNSLIQLLAVDAAKLPEKVKLSDDTGVILRELQRLRDDFNLVSIKDPFIRVNKYPRKSTSTYVILPNGESAALYSKIYRKTEEAPFLEDYGIVVGRDRNSTLIKKGEEILFLADNDELWKKLTVEDFTFSIR